MERLPGVSVIIPTAAWTARGAALRRAIASVLAQEGVDLEVIVVVNGPDHDRDLLAKLRADPRLRVEFRAEASLPAAHRHGRRLVSKPYFSFIDDDDEFLPGALRTRATTMMEDDSIDVVATNGVWGGDAGGSHIPHAAGVEDDALGALLRSNWLGSCGALFRTATVTEDFFDGRTRHYEWTMIAFRIALAGLRVRFLDVPTYRMNETENSLSRSDEYFMAAPGFLESLLEHPLQPRHRGQIHRKRLAALHYLAEYCCVRGNLGMAWRFHLRSMRGRYGLKYAVFTRRLVMPTLRHLGRRLTGGRDVRERRIPT
jgi:glycosyltransferase involved in cell wall biosynthesis